MDQFIKNHRLQVLGTLSGWDRIRFRGTFRVLSAVPGLFTWLNGQDVLLKDFKKFAMELTDRLRASVEAVAAASGRKIEYLASSALSKEALVNELLRPRENRAWADHHLQLCRSLSVVPDTSGCSQEAARFSVSVAEMLALVSVFHASGVGFVSRADTAWRPFTVHICINGREGCAGRFWQLELVFASVTTAWSM